MKEKHTLESLLTSDIKKEILFLGREQIFTQKEIERFLKKHNATYTKELSSETVAVVEHNILNPVEDMLSNEAYEQSLPIFKLKDFEELISKTINEDELLMGVKLANDQERIFRLLSNASFSNKLFIKLLALYDWDEEDEDSRYDRDVIMYTLRRYISIKPNEEDLLYSYLTLRRLATEADDPALLLVLINFPNYTFNIRGKKRVTLRETIAKNLYIDNSVVSKLVSFRDEKINLLLAANPSVPTPFLEKLLEKADKSMAKSLAFNKNITFEMFKKLLKYDDEVISTLLLFQNIDKKKYELLKMKSLNSKFLYILATNKNIDEPIYSLMFDEYSEDSDFIISLAQNDSIPKSLVEKIYNIKNAEVLIYIARNPVAPTYILEEIYENYKQSSKVLISLAYNDATPSAILDKLYSIDDFEINKGLATNSSLNREHLNELAIDTRLQHYLAQNKIFIDDYEQTLIYDRKAID